MINEDFKNAVMSKDIDSVRIMLKDSLLLDPTGKLFNELFSLANTSLSNNLLEKHDGENFVLDKSKWTKDYLNEEMVKLIYNFSPERIDLLKSMCKEIYADYIQEQENKARKNIVVKQMEHKVRTTGKASSNRNIVKYIVISIIIIACIILFKSC